MKIAAQISVLALTAALAGCTQTTYRSYEPLNGGAVNKDDRSERRVNYNISKAYYRAAPDCVVVLPAQGLAKVRDKKMIERAAARHLRGKIARVIGPAERQILTRRLALDLSTAADRRYLANYYQRGQFKRGSCRFFATPAILGISEEFALVWASRRIHLSLEISRGRTGESLWKSDHAADRGDGGLPLSPLSLGTAIFRAGQVRADKDMLPSMIDDVFRRIFLTLPDTRSY